MANPRAGGRGRRGRVLEHVADDVPGQVFVTEDSRSVPRMEEMPGSTVPPVERLGIDPLQPLHAAVEVRLGRAEHDVEVIPHEAVREARP
jgi:hypothetical protein